jgi:hypothetical protein
MDKKWAWLAPTIILAGAHYGSFGIARTPLVTDVKLYVYFAAQHAAGAVPYRDFFDIKTPLATIVGALLIHTGRFAGLDDLAAIRIGYLAIATVVPILYFLVFTRLCPQEPESGFLGACAFFAFPLLGFMPSIGNIPKLLMAVSAVAAVILVGRKRWYLAGAAGVLAYLDWQIGIISLVAVFVGALFDHGKRIRSVCRAAIGAAACITPFVLYFLWNGALGSAYHQTVLCARARGGSAPHNLYENFLHVKSVVEQGCRGHEWLVIMAVFGACIFPFWIRRASRGKILSQVATLGVFHYGVLAYSLFDFQRFGDLFVLLHSIAFFLGVAFAELARCLRHLFARSEILSSWRYWRPGIPTFLICITVVLATRPSVLRSEYSLVTKDNPFNATLSDQREVNEALEVFILGKRLAFFAYVEQLCLSGRRNDVFHAGWNPGNHFHERLSPEESSPDTWLRVLRDACPEVVAAPRGIRDDTGFVEYFERVRLASKNDAYRIEVFVLRQPGPGDRYGHEFCTEHDNLAGFQPQDDR